jgi:hypothetical protein
VLLRLMPLGGKRLRREETVAGATNRQPKACATKRHLLHAQVYHNWVRVRTEADRWCWFNFDSTGNVTLGARTSRPHSVRSTLSSWAFPSQFNSRFALNADETSALPAETRPLSSNCTTTCSMVAGQFECGTRILRMAHGRDARATLSN